MDRPLDERTARRRRVRRGAWIAGVAAVLSGAVLWLPALVRPAVSRSAIRSAVADVGPVEAVISASGTVTPEVEQVVSSPVDARVLRILRRTGVPVSRGDALVELDVNESRLAVEKLAQDLAIKQNAQARTRLTLQKNLLDLNGRADVKRLQLESLRSQLARDRALSAEGLLSQELLKKSELAVAQSEIELRQLQDEAANAEAATRTEIAGLELEMAKLRKEEAEARRLLDLASPRADRDGVVTSALTEEGVAIRKGDVIARIADLRSFKVTATVSDVHAGRLAPGLPVAVKAGNTTLEGAVSAVLPTIENGAVTMHVGLREPAHPALRANLRVDVLVITARKPQVVRVRRGPYAVGEGTQSVFVIRGDRAVRTPVTIGVTSFDHYEIVAGVSAGDEVITSDMSDYARLREVRIR